MNEFNGTRNFKSIALFDLKIRPLKQHWSVGLKYQSYEHGHCLILWSANLNNNWFCKVTYKFKNKC